MNPSQFLRSTIVDLKDIDESELVPDLTLEDLGLDSLDYVEVQVGIKKHFGVEIDNDLFKTGAINTLGDLARYIEERSTIAAPATVSAPLVPA